MERKIRVFKRSFQIECGYNETLMNQMDIRQYKSDIYTLHPEKVFSSKMKMEKIKRKKITKRIVGLPQELQKRIYFITMRKYWRAKTLSTSLRPFWCDYKLYLDNELKKSVIDNVHFMHLEFNTLPENKEFIPGCQCPSCKKHSTNLSPESKTDLYDELLGTDLNAFNRIVHCHDLIPNKWNQYEKIYGDLLNHTITIIFDPLRDMFEDKLMESPIDSPIYFSNELSNSLIQI
jgi:hypothetical protein